MAEQKNEEVAVVEQKEPTVKKKQTLAKRKPSAEPITMEQVFMEAIQTPDLNPANLKQLVEIKERLEAKAAEKKFNEALSLAQNDMKPVVATKTNTQTESKYAPIENVNVMAMPIASKHGFSVSFSQAKSEI